MTVATPWDAVAVPEEFTRGFVPAYFGAVDLGHKSRNERFTRVAQQISRHPGGSLPDKLATPAGYAAMDRLMNRPEVTHAQILAAHRERTLAKMTATPGVVLLLHDTTVLDYSSACRWGWRRSVTVRAAATCVTTRWRSIPGVAKCLAWCRRSCISVWRWVVGKAWRRSGSGPRARAACGAGRSKSCHRRQRANIGWTSPTAARICSSFGARAATPAAMRGALGVRSPGAPGARRSGRDDVVAHAFAWLAGRGRRP